MNVLNAGTTSNLLNGVCPTLDLDIDLCRSCDKLIEKLDLQLYLLLVGDGLEVRVRYRAAQESSSAVAVETKSLFKMYNRRGPPPHVSPTSIFRLSVFLPSQTFIFLPFLIPTFLLTFLFTFLSSCLPHYPSSRLSFCVPLLATHSHCSSKPLRHSPDSHVMHTGYGGIGYVGGSRVCGSGRGEGVGVRV